jgi:hypothetical protein
MRLLAVVATLIAPAMAMADSPADKKLATTGTELLGDRMSVMLPAGMRVAPRRANIMSAEAAGEDETRAMLDDGKARFVMMSYELYALAGADVKATVEADAKSQNLTAPLEALALPKPLVGFAIAPPVGKDREANLTYAAWILSGDGTMQFVAFYVNPDGAAQGPAWAAVGKKIAATLAPGKRVIAPKAGDRKLSDGLAISVGDGWVATQQPGPDFTVNRLRKLVVLGQSAPSCGVYIGHHPSPQYRQTDAKAKATTVAGKLFGGKVDWTTWSANHRSLTETMAKHPSASDTVHVFCGASSEAELAELRKMAETLRKS